MTSDAADLRYERAARYRERCLQELRAQLGGHLPRPAVAAVHELCERLLLLNATPDEALEHTVVR